MIMNIFRLVLCHFIGDYFLQDDYLASNKGKDWYLLFAHCMLYCLPFAFLYGYDYRLLVLLATHFYIDAMKARYKKIDILVDQILHYTIIFCLYILA